MLNNKICIAGIVVLSAAVLSGCARLKEKADKAGLTEIPKIMWGSSMKALEDARAQAAHKTYTCSAEQCFDETLKIAKSEKWEVFISDKRKSHIVLMGIPGSIETTEVGVFFSDIDAEKTKVEVVSLSTQAQETAAETLFKNLKTVFSEIP